MRGVRFFFQRPVQFLKIIAYIIFKVCFILFIFSFFLILTAISFFCAYGNLVSEENRKLMQDILNRSQSENEDMSSRVRVLLAGSALTTKAGVRIERRDTIEQVDYTAVGEFILDHTAPEYIFMKTQHQARKFKKKSSQKNW